MLTDFGWCEVCNVLTGDPVTDGLLITLELLDVGARAIPVCYFVWLAFRGVG